jgi:hypothetical protein
MKFTHSSLLILCCLSLHLYAIIPAGNHLPDTYLQKSRNGQRVGISYYVDVLRGKDSNDGSIKRPFSTLEAVNRLKLLPGDRIYLAGGQTFEGILKINKFNGQSEKGLMISSYGKGCATINGKTKSALMVDSSAYVSIRNVIVKGDGRLNGNDGSGVDVKNSSCIIIDRVEASGFLWKGISTYGGHDIKLTRIYAHDNGSTGMEVSGPWSHKEVKNVYIAHCVAENNPGNPRIKDNHSGSGILISQATGVLIEDCEAMNNGWDMPRPGNGPVGIWAYECDSLTIQYCYSHDNKTSPEGKDGGGFDFDGGVTNSIMHHNLSMNNEGAGYGLFQFWGASQWKNNIIRNNVSINDGSKNSHAGFFIWCDPYSKLLPLTNCSIYKNIVISSHGHSVVFETGFAVEMRFYDNTFCLTNNGTEHIWGDYTKDEVSFKENVYWSEQAEKDGTPQPNVKEDSEGKYSKPTFKIPQDIRLERSREVIVSFFK